MIASGDALVLVGRGVPGSLGGDLDCEITLHYQGDRDEQACAQAVHNALAAGSSGGAALLRVADDPALGLDLDQWEHLHRIATELSLRVVEDLGGANSDGTTTADGRPAAG